MLEQIKSTVAFLQEKTNNFKPDLGIILGTGLGRLVNDIDIAHTINYKDIPNFPVSTVESHSGKLIFGELEGKKVVVMQGRFHYYEGYSMKQVTFPVRVMKFLGIERLLVSNVSGGLNPAFKVGDLMVINDHISLLLPEFPLTGKNDDTLGSRFPDMLHTYEPAMVEQGYTIAQKSGFGVHKGVYVSVAGPCLETPAEYKMLRIIGADAVGMSTVPEIIVARHMGIPCFAISIITDMCTPECIKEVNIEEIISIAMEAEPKLTKVVRELVSSF